MNREVESNRMEKDIPCKQHKKDVTGFVITHDVDFDITSIKRTFHNDKDIIYQENNNPKCVCI